MIELLIGMIASGKSTYSLARAKEGALVISHDSMIDSLHCQYTYDKALHDTYHAIEEATLEAIIKHSDRDIIIDRTHLTRRSRMRWTAIAKKHNVPIIAVKFKIWNPEVHAGRRHFYNSRGLSYDKWREIATAHINEADPLDLALEGFTGERDATGYFPGY